MEADENGNKICDETVHFITDKIMDFIDSKYSLYKWDEVEEICKAAVILFPYIELVGDYFLILHCLANNLVFSSQM